MITIKYKNIYDTFINHYKEEHVSPFREISEMELNQIFIDLVKVCQVTNLSQSLNELKKKGYWVIGSDCRDATDYRKVDYNMALVLVIGSEGKGMHRLVKQNCDILVKLPMESNFESLNASVACSVLLYQIYNCRNPI